MTPDDEQHDKYGQADGHAVDGHAVDGYAVDGYAVDAGRVVPNYALTKGRTRSQGDELAIEALVTSTPAAQRSAAALEPEGRQIVELADRPTSVMEIATQLNVPLGVARVLVSDLANAGWLDVHLPPSTAGDTGPGRAVLGRLLDGLRAR